MNHIRKAEIVMHVKQTISDPSSVCVCVSSGLNRRSAIVHGNNNQNAQQNIQFLSGTTPYHIIEVYKQPVNHISLF